MNILLVNDDSIYAPGIITLANALKKEHRVFVIAPEQQMSGTSHSITFYGFLNYEKIDIIDGCECYILKGTPSDCTKFGIDVILGGFRPDVVISGINKGYNIGTDILYSGTVNAALEGAIFQIKSIAVSQNYDCDNFDFASRYIRKNLTSFLDIIPEKDYVCLNINIPSDKEEDIKGTKLVKVGENRYADYYEYVDERGYMIKGNPILDLPNEIDTDVEMIKQNYITLSFVKSEFNDYNAYEKHKGFTLWNA